MGSTHLQGGRVVMGMLYLGGILIREWDRKGGFIMGQNGEEWGCRK